jgi:hypothetical protein
MKRLVLALFCACALSGCAGAPRSPAQAIFALQAGYDAALDIAVAYAGLPRCGPDGLLLCSDRALVRQVHSAAHKAWIALQAVQSLARAQNPDPSALATARTAAELALAALTALTAQMKVS